MNKSLMFLCVLICILIAPVYAYPQTFCYGNRGMCVDGSNISMDRNIVMGDNTTSYNLTINDAGTIIMKDDGGDTSITIGPVTDGTTTLGMTGGINASGDITANQFHGSGATLTDIPSSGMGNGDHGDFTYNGGNATLDNDTVSIDEMADSDHGDFTYSSGSATLDTGVVADNEIDYSAVTLDDFDYQTAWRLFYSNTDGDVTELALGSSGEYLKSQGASSAPTWDTPAGGGASYLLEASDGDPNDAVSVDADGNVAIQPGNLDLGADDVISILTIHDAGTIVIYDDSDDTSVTIGPVGNGTTVLSITGALDISGQTSIGNMTIDSGSITDSSGSISFGNENLSTTGAVDLGGATSLEIPNNNGDVTADAGVELFYDEAEDQWVFYDSQGGELNGEEVADTAIKYFSARLDPGNHYDRDQDIFLITVGDNFPSGVKIDEWKTSCNCDPDVEIDADLFYADDWKTLTNLTIMDALDTSAGVSSEDTDSSINSGAAVANGKVIGVRMNLDPEGTCNQYIIEVWCHGID